MRNIYQQGINIGVGFVQDPHAKKRVQFLNFICLISILMCLGVSLIALFVEEYLWQLSCLCQIFICCTALYLTGHGKFVTAYRLLSLLTFISMMGVALLLGEAAHMEQLLPMLFMMYSVFAQSTKETYLCLAVCILGFILCFVFYNYLEPWEVLERPALAWSSTMSISLVLLALLGRFYFDLFQITEASLKEKDDVLKKESKANIINLQEIKKARSDLRNQEAKYELLFKHASDAIIIVDTRTLQAVSFNTQALHMFGSDTEQFGTVFHDQLLSPKQNKDKTGFQMLQSWIKSLEKGDRIREEWTLFKKEELPPIVELTVMAMPAPQQHLVSLFLRDVSIERRAAVKREEVVESLEEVNEELKRFAYIVSHDLKAPLRAIGSLADWLEADYAKDLDKQGVEIVNLINGRVGRMHNLIEGILSYSRVSRDKEEKAFINTQKLLEQVIYSLAPPSHIKIKLRSPLVDVYFERTRLEQLFLNLISNSITFMDKEEGLVEIGSKENADNIIFYVTDNGPGIEESYYHKIFQIFQTLQARDSFESMGIGLAIVKKIVDRYGGEIGLRSKKGKGCSFHIKFPKSVIGTEKQLLVQKEL